jgi:HEAT repeat protein
MPARERSASDDAWPYPKFDRAAWERRNVEVRAARAPVEEALRAAGLEIDELSDLVNTKVDYRAQVPVLLEQLPRAGHPAVRTMIVRALTTPWARPAAGGLLIEEFERPEGGAERWVVGNALKVVAGEEHYPDVVRLFRDRRYGRDRRELAGAIARLRQPSSFDVLAEGLADDDVLITAIEALGTLKDPRAVPLLRPHLTHADAHVRREAQRALRKVEGPPA